MNDSQAETRCALCGHAGPMRERFAELQVVACPGCDLVFYEGAVRAAEIYDEGYFNGEEYRDYLADKPIIQRNFAGRIEDLRRLRPSGRLLEIGAAYGFFLELAARHWDVKGFEISEAAAAHARAAGLDVSTGDFLSAPLDDETFDVICMWDTIEHLEHPVETVARAARLLAPGGVLVVTTGDIASLVARVRGASWRLVHPPSHAFYFSPRTLGRALSDAGLHVHRTTHVGYSRSYRSMAHGVFGEASWATRALTLGGRLDFPTYLNFFDIMMMVGQKPS